MSRAHPRGRAAPRAQGRPAPSATGSRQLGYWSTVPGRLGCRRSPTASPYAASTSRLGSRRAPRASRGHVAVVLLEQALLLSTSSSASRSCAPGPLLLDRDAELAELVPDPDVLLGEEAGRGRQVVGGDAGERRRPPRRRRQERAVVVALEPQHRAAEHAGRVERLAHAVLDGAEVLADDHRAGAERLEGEHAEHGVGVVRDVGALGGGRAPRHPPQPEQAHDVVDAQPAGVPQDAAHDVAERRVAGLRRAGRAATAAGPSPGPAG